MERDRIPCGPIFNIKEAVENPQIESRNMIVKAFHKVVGDFKLAGNPIKMSNYKCSCGKTKNVNGNCDGSHKS